MVGNAFMRRACLFDVFIPAAGIATRTLASLPNESMPSGSQGTKANFLAPQRYGPDRLLPIKTTGP